jgi:hypothetical protein
MHADYNAGGNNRITNVTADTNTSNGTDPSNTTDTRTGGKNGWMQQKEVQALGDN